MGPGVGFGGATASLLRLRLRRGGQAGLRRSGRLSPARLPAAAVAASAIPALGTTPGGRPRARSGFQEAGGGAFQPSLAVAAAPRAPSGPSPAPARPHTGSLRAPGASSSSRGRGAGAQADGRLGAPCTCRAVQVAARALRLWAGASAALCAPGGGGRGGAAPVPAPFNFAAAAATAAPRAGGRRRGRSWCRIPHEVLTGGFCQLLPSARRARAAPGLHVPDTSAAQGGCTELGAGRPLRGRGKALPRGSKTWSSGLSKQVGGLQAESGRATRAPGGLRTGVLLTAGHLGSGALRAVPEGSGSLSGAVRGLRGVLDYGGTPQGWSFSGLGVTKQKPRGSEGPAG